MTNVAFGAGELDAADYFAGERLLWAEKTFQAEVLKRAGELGWEHLYHSFFSKRSEKGFPDIIAVRPATGQLIAAELKTMKGIVGTRQHEWLEAFRAVQNVVAARAIGPNGRLYVAVYLWRPCCLNSGELLEALR